MYIRDIYGVDAEARGDSSSLSQPARAQRGLTSTKGARNLLSGFEQVQASRLLAAPIAPTGTSYAIEWMERCCSLLTLVVTPS